MWCPKDKRTEENKDGLRMQEQKKKQTLIILPSPTL